MKIEKKFNIEKMNIEGTFGIDIKKPFYYGILVDASNGNRINKEMIRATIDPEGSVQLAKVMARNIYFQLMNSNLIDKNGNLTENAWNSIKSGTIETKTDGLFAIYKLIKNDLFANKYSLIGISKLEDNEKNQNKKSISTNELVDKNQNSSLKFEYMENMFSFSLLENSTYQKYDEKIVKAKLEIDSTMKKIELIISNEKIRLDITKNWDKIDYIQIENDIYNNLGISVKENKFIVRDVPSIKDSDNFLMTINTKEMELNIFDNIDKYELVPFNLEMIPENDYIANQWKFNLMIKKLNSFPTKQYFKKLEEDVNIHFKNYHIEDIDRNEFINEISKGKYKDEFNMQYWFASLIKDLGE